MERDRLRTELEILDDLFARNLIDDWREIYLVSMEELIEKRDRLQSELKALDQMIERERKKSIYVRRFPPRSQDHIETCNQVIKDLIISQEDSTIGGKDAVNSKEDQIKILRHMRDSKIPFVLKPSLGSLFGHADNVRFTYDEYKTELPLWFRHKYRGSLAT